MTLQPPVTQLIHEGARDSANTTSWEAKLAENKPSPGLLLLLAVLWLLTRCTRVQLRMGKLSVRAPSATLSNLAMEKKRVCVYWFPPLLLFLVCYVVSALPGAVSTGGAVTASLSHTDTRVCAFGAG